MVIQLFKSEPIVISRDNINVNLPDAQSLAGVPASIMHNYILNETRHIISESLILLSCANFAVDGKPTNDSQTT